MAKWRPHKAAAVQHLVERLGILLNGSELNGFNTYTQPYVRRKPRTGAHKKTPQRP